MRASPIAAVRPDPAQSARVTRAVTSFTVTVVAVLALAKLFAAWASGSIAVLSSLADSALDVAASLVTFFMVRYAAKPADAEHRYGHGKAEAVAALIQVVLVVVSAALIAREAWVRLADPSRLAAEGVALVVMAVSLGVTVLLVTVQARAVRATGSVAVSGDRAHYTADLAANAAVIGALAVSAAGGPAWVDPLVGAALALWLLKGAWTIAGAALDQMMDRELSEIERAEIRRLALADPRVRAIRALRTRAAGPHVHIQFNVELADELSLIDAHAIMVEAEWRVLGAFPGADILVHPDPSGWTGHHGDPRFAPAGEAGEPTTSSTDPDAASGFGDAIQKGAGP